MWTIIILIFDKLLLVFTVSFICNSWWCVNQIWFIFYILYILAMVINWILTETTLKIIIIYEFMTYLNKSRIVFSKYVTISYYIFNLNTDELLNYFMYFSIIIIGLWCSSFSSMKKKLTRMTTTRWLLKCSVA